MSRILDSMKLRIEKLQAKILPLQNELDSLSQAINILEKQEGSLPQAVADAAAASESVKEPTPHFIGKKSHA